MIRDVLNTPYPPDPPDEDEIETPWGPGHTNSSSKKGDGITFYETPGHGGFRLSEERRHQFHERFPLFRTFASCYGGGGTEQEWFEEDQDWAAVCLAFADGFSAQEITDAVWTLNRAITVPEYGENKSDATYLKGWLQIREWLCASPDGRALQGIAAEYREHVRWAWERGCISTHGGDWHVILRRAGDDKRQTRRFAEYPSQRYYTDEELARLSDPHPLTWYRHNIGER